MKPSEQTRTVAGKYELVKMLGQGGMGEVWVAREIATGHEVALKLLRSGTSESKENRARFEREAKIAKTLVSPHIAQVTDSGVDEDGNPFMALELLHGEDLQKRIKTEKHLPLAFVVRLAIQVGRALHVAHSAGLVHRDLKPANIFLARQGDEEIAKVLDFGIAKTGSMENTQYTAAGAMLGTASYMSPEQIRNAKAVDHRADLWAFAVCLFRALTGELPFTLTGFELFLALAQDPIPTPQKVTSLAPDLPGPLNIFFERAFLKEMDQRYPNASAMVVGFCRAAGVTVPADVLYAADAPMPTAPISGPLSGVRTSSVPSMPAVSPPSAGPVSPPAAPPPPSSGGPSLALAGTMMLDSPLPDPLGTGEHGRPAVDPHARGSGLPPASSAPIPAAGQPAGPHDVSLDPEDADNAATLFYQPAIPNLPAGPPDSRGPSSGGSSDGPGKPQVFTVPLDAARAAAAGAQLAAMDRAAAAASPGAHDEPSGPSRPIAARPDPSRAARVWIWVMAGILLAVTAGALVFLFLNQE